MTSGMEGVVGESGFWVITCHPYRKLRVDSKWGWTISLQTHLWHASYTKAPPPTVFIIFPHSTESVQAAYKILPFHLAFS